MQSPKLRLDSKGNHTSLSKRMVYALAILVELAHAAGCVADHVNYLGLGGLKDWQLMGTIRQQDYAFVTNNCSDFLALHGREPLHAGVIIIVPSVVPVCQRELFSAALKHIGARDTVVEVKI